MLFCWALCKQTSIVCSHATVKLALAFRKQWGWGAFVLCPPNTCLEAQLPGWGPAVVQRSWEWIDEGRKRHCWDFHDSW